MTSPADVAPEPTTEDAESEGHDDTSGSATPWTRPGPHRSRPEDKVTPGAPGATDQNRPAAQGQPGQNGQNGTGTPGPGTTPVPGTGTTAAPPSAAPGAAPAAPPPAAPQPPPQAAVAQLPAPPPGAEPPPPEPGIDMDTVAELAPAALSAGAMAMAMLPMLASALSGLNGGGSNGQTGGATGTGTGGASGTGDGQLSPEAQHALAVLKKLQSVYGSDDPLGPNTKHLADEVTSGSTGSGTTAKAVKLRRLYQRTAAKAFNNLDNQLFRYMRSIAGNNKINKKAVNQLIREVDTALAELGPAAYTKAGQQKVHQILTIAVQRAEKIVSADNVTAAQTAAEINQLTKQYIYNLAGKNYTATNAAGGAGAGGSPAAQKAIQVALAQVGDPYVWGAEGPNSFDCSGLMQYSARAAGVNIPRVAADQYRSLPKVRPSDIQPGDLIFPAAQYNGGNPGHVMMYIGNGKCVEAPSAGKNVQVTSLPSSYYAARWAN
ncbi:NlpC/P60 family protein [Nocardia blacklockiae]|uniref:NlpC/P60 family protein n=1 Tax=Nocardia blacklockiae TaxID=480036 RepID=UPI0018960F4E|nr:NlpC/P60 family protein [Nocardia blacklockiae]MBF6175661.1 C40 family peptidase [Nocardia blacklockiae]